MKISMDNAVDIQYSKKKYIIIMFYLRCCDISSCVQVSELSRLSSGIPFIPDQYTVKGYVRFPGLPLISSLESVINGIKYYFAV